MNDKATKQGVEEEGGGRRERWGSESFLRSLQGIEQTQMVWRDDISRPEAPLEAESLHTECNLRTARRKVGSVVWSRLYRETQERLRNTQHVQQG